MMTLKGRGGVRELWQLRETKNTQLAEFYWADLRWLKIFPIFKIVNVLIVHKKSSVDIGCK